MKSQQHVEHMPFMESKSGEPMSLPNFYFVGKSLVELLMKTTEVINILSFLALVSGLTAVAVCAVVGAGICYFR